MTNTDTNDNDYERALAGWLAPAAKPPPSPAEETDDDGLFGAGRKSPEHFAALDQVREWTRQRFKLPPDAAIVVSELTCTIPGCPPLETAVAFWEGETRYHFKLLRRVEEVTAEHLPYAWQKESLIMPDGFGCECC